MEPKYVIKTISYNGEKVTYWGLGYKVIRYVGVSPKEPFKNNIGVKYGSWFMKYELEDNSSTNIEYSFFGNFGFFRICNFNTNQIVFVGCRF